MPNTTVIIPVGPDHHAISQRAIASVNDQTREAALIVIHDHEGRGPGWARNRGIVQAQTPYVLFLDADDWLTPGAVEVLEGVIKPRWFAYGDWIVDGVVMKAPTSDKLWGPSTFNIVTALLPLDKVKAVRGFDESLHGAEDKDLFLKFFTACVCGIHAGVPILNYTADGARARAFRDRPDYKRQMAEIEGRYKVDMACCGKEDIPEVPLKPIENGILLEPRWYGNQNVTGTATGREYGRLARGKRAYIDRRDWAAMNKSRWEVIELQQEAVDIFDLDEIPLAETMQEAGNLLFPRQPDGAVYRPAVGKGRTLSDIIMLGNEDE